MADDQKVTINAQQAFSGLDPEQSIPSAKEPASPGEVPKMELVPLAASARSDGASPERDAAIHVSTAPVEEDDLHDLARDVDDPLPGGVPGQRTGTDDQAEVPVRDEVHYPDPAAETDPGAIAAITAKLGVTTPGLRACRLNLGVNRLAALNDGDVVRLHAPLDAVRWSPLGLGVEKRVAPTLIEQRAAEHEAMGQVRPCRARLMPDGHVELLTGMLEWLAARHLATTGKLIGSVLIDLELLDDVSARKLVYADAAGDVKLAPIDLARWAQDAIKSTWSTQRKLAKALGLDEANVTRLIYVADAVEILDGVITDEWAVSRAQASRLMVLWNDRSRRPEIRTFIAGLAAASAAKTFKAIFERFERPPEKRPGEVDVVGDDDQILGRLRQTAGGKVLMELDTVSGAVELPALIGFVETAFAQLRASAG